MKANLLLALMLFSFGNLCFGQWAIQSSPTTNNLNDVSFLDAKLGFAVGDGGTVIRTINGGQTWKRISFPESVNLVSVALPDTGIVIITTSINENGEAAVYSSSNGGTTWVKTLQDSRTFYAAATPAKHIFSTSSKIYESADNGKTWVSRADINSTSSYSAIEFPDVQHGTVAGNISGFVTYSAMFLRSQDNGTTWYASYPYDFPNANGFSAMSVLSADSVFMFTNFYNRFSPGDSSQLIFLSNFRLRRSLSDPEWHFNAKTVVSSFQDRINTCKFFRTGVAYTAGEKGSIYRSTNFGKKWSAEFTNKLPVNDIYMVNENTGYAVGDGGLILKRDTAIKKLSPQMIAVKAFPNPVKDKASLSFTLTEPTMIAVQVTGERGNAVLNIPAKNYEKGLQQISLQVANLQRGLYHVNLVSKGITIAKTELLVIH